jgi:hypothetical protein
MAAGSSAAFAARTHATDYDLQLHLDLREAHPTTYRFRRRRELCEAAESEVAHEPLSHFALLERDDGCPTASGHRPGIKVNDGGHAGFGFEMHDFLTPFPEKIIALRRTQRLADEFRMSSQQPA